MTSATSWRERLEKCRATALAEASPSAFKVFAALLDHAKLPDGYCWPKVETLCELTALSRRSVFNGVSELVRLGVLFRRRLVDAEHGRTLPNLYRIGSPVEEIPARMALKAVLAIEKADLKPRKRREVQKMTRRRVQKMTRRRVQNLHPEVREERERVPSHGLSQDSVSQSVSESKKKEKQKANGAPASEDLTDRLTDKTFAQGKLQ